MLVYLFFDADSIEFLKHSDLILPRHLLRLPPLSFALLTAKTVERRSCVVHFSEFLLKLLVAPFT